MLLSEAMPYMVFVVVVFGGMTGLMIVSWNLASFHVNQTLNSG
jgi:hypothetical protein